MAAFLKQAVALLAGNMAGSNNKATFVVKSLRTVYVVNGTAILVIWYSAWRNERVKIGEAKFPFPGATQLKRRFAPDRPEAELAEEEAGIAPHKEWGTSRGKRNPNKPVIGFGAGYYVFPFTPNATWGRTDMGVDFGGSGPIFAIGKCRIVKATSPWPEYGNTGVLYQLLDGPRAGQIIYVYEGVKVNVRPNDIIEKGHMIGQIVPLTTSGIEIGFAESSGNPLASSEYVEGKETVYGKEMRAFLEELKGKR